MSVFAPIARPVIFPDDPLDRGLVAEWRFDRHTGLVLPGSGPQRYNGVITSATWLSGRYGPALDFDASNDDVQITPGNTDLLDFDDVPFSIEFMAEADAWGLSGEGYRSSCVNRQWEASGQGGYRLGFGGGFGTASEQDRITFEIREASFGSWRRAVGATDLSLNTVYHFMGTYDGNNDALVYVNGSQDGSVISSGIEPVAGNVDLWLGRRAAAADRRLNGRIYLVRIYDRELKPDEVKARCQAAFARASGLKANWFTPFSFPAVAAGVSIPIAMYYRQHVFSQAGGGN